MSWNKMLLISAYVFGNLLWAASANQELSRALLARTGTLRARQSNSICSTACTDSLTVIKDCTRDGVTAACLCTVPNAHLLQSCIDCSTTPSIPSSVSDSQVIATSFNSLCVSSASAIKPLTVPGGAASSSLSAGVSVTAPGSPSLPPTSLSSATAVPTSSPFSQVTIGPSTTTSDPTLPATTLDATGPPRGDAMRTTPTLGMWSIMMLTVAYYCL